MVPLWHGNLRNIEEEIVATIPGWRGIGVTSHAKYLGFTLGPGRKNISYDKPAAKYLDRAGCWGQAGAGLYLTATAYTIYVASVIGFLIQLDGLPDNWNETEGKAFERLVPGFGLWCSTDDLHNLKRYGFPKGFVDMQLRSQAAKIRVAHLEATATGGLQVQQRAEALRTMMNTNDDLHLRTAWAEWFSKSFLL